MTRLADLLAARPWPLVMGVVNLTPDSFSDGGRFLAPEAALAHARALLAAGADLLDLGAESTRPGAAPVSPEEERRRLLPVVSALAPWADAAGALLSIDTRHPETFRAAWAAGGRLWNDVSALSAPGAPALAAALGCDVCLMHMAGTPATMQAEPRYEDVVADIFQALAARVAAARSAGVATDALLVDPGIGFGKTVAHNLSLLASLARFRALAPVLLGASRKRFVAAVAGDGSEPADRLGGSLAAALAGAARGVAVVRVHDVAETIQALRVWRAIAAADPLR